MSSMTILLSHRSREITMTNGLDTIHQDITTLTLHGYDQDVVDRLQGCDLLIAWRVSCDTLQESVDYAIESYTVDNPLVTEMALQKLLNAARINCELSRFLDDDDPGMRNATMDQINEGLNNYYGKP